MASHAKESIRNCRNDSSAVISTNPAWNQCELRYPEGRLKPS
jgi:hypothetical protein